MKKCSHSSHESLTELNITPLLDLAFVLLVIFIITTIPPRTQLSFTSMCPDTRMRNITITTMSTTSTAGTPMAPSPRNWPVPAAGGVV